MKERLLSILIILTVAFILGPIFTFLHELGHALVPILNGANVRIVMGVESFNLFSFSVGSLEVIWNNTFLPWVGYTLFDESTSVAYILGPLTSLSLFLFLRFVITKKLENDFVVRICFSGSYWCLIQGVLTLIPLKYPTWLTGYESFTSDGMKFLNSFI